MSAALRYPPLMVALAAGLVLRVGLMLGYSPAVLSHYDSIGYLDAASTGLFDDPIRPAGYSLFLRIVSFPIAKLEVAIGVQHLLGLVTALLLFMAIDRLDVPRWIAVVPAAVVCLSGDQLFLEHAVMSEALFTFLVAAGLYAAVRTLEPGPGWAWALGAGALIAVAATARSAGLFMLPVLAVWLLLARGRPLRPRLVPAFAATGVALAVLGAYLGAHAAVDGTVGFTRSGGWAVYGRSAPFADCNEFEPPKGTERLCERRPADQRPGPDFYAWVDQGSPARIAFGGPPAADQLVGEFGRRAIIAQPLDYLGAVAKDLARYVDPHIGRDAPFSGDGPEGVSFARRDRVAEGASLQAVGRFYGEDDFRVRGIVATYRDYGEVVRMHGALIALALLLSIAGGLFARGRPRAVIVLFAGSAFVLAAVPAATGEYTARYAVPGAGPLAAAGALGAWACWARLRKGGPAPAPPARSGAV